MSINNLKKQRKASKGITLIALVITIIVLLILATVSINTLTEENGILSKTNTAKTDTERATAKEKVQMAVMSSYDNTGKLDYVQLKTNLDKVESIDKTTVPIPITVLPITVKVDGYEVTIGENGDVTVAEKSTGDNPTPNPPVVEKSELEKAKEAGAVLNENKSTTITDTYGNEVKVPEGFKIASDSATDVTGGVVIEDVCHGATAGSQFVWIPVGTVYTSQDKSTSETIVLNRYTFDSNGNPTPQGENIIDNFEELVSSDKDNTIAKDIEIFKTNATTNKGYYIGRYEARSVTRRTSATDSLAQVTVKPNDHIYNYVTQPQAATLARGMYGEEKKFISDLINSYAWDTTIVFLQAFDNRNDKSKPYAKQNSLNTSLELQGTNYLADKTKQDKICNIWDMASNCLEWNTETYKNYTFPAVTRSGTCDDNSFYASDRNYSKSSISNNYFSFRLVLYVAV